MSKRKIDKNGWMQVDDNPIAKSGIFPYLGSEIRGIDGLDPNKIYRVYRSDDELIKALESFKNIPIIDDHEMLGENATPAERKGVHGWVGESVYFDSPYIRGNLKVVSNALMDLIDAGKEELSPGYYSKFAEEAGEHEGQSYDFIQYDLRANHLALVEEGRSGRDVAVLDSQIKENIDMNFEELLAAIAALSEEDKAKLKAALEGATQDEKPEEGETKDEEPETVDTDKAEDAAEAAVEAADAAEAAATAAETAAETGSEAAAEAAKDAAEEAVDAAEEALEKLDQATMDAMQRKIAKDFAERDKLVSRLKPHVGVFDHSHMVSARDVAIYGGKKLGVKLTKGAEVAIMDAWLHGRGKAAKEVAVADNAMKKNANGIKAKMGYR